MSRKKPNTTADHTVYDPLIVQQLSQATQTVLQVCISFEQQSTAQAIALARTLFQERTAPWFEQSTYMHRARHWPRGYPGDFAMIEGIYQGAPQAVQGIGLYLDVYFLSRRIVVAALPTSMVTRTPCPGVITEPSGYDYSESWMWLLRELFELAWELEATRPQVTCIDNDPAALAIRAEFAVVRRSSLWPCLVRVLQRPPFCSG